MNQRIPFFTKPFRDRVSAFSLIEVTLSLGIIAFALVTLLALVPLGVKSNQLSAEETRATFLLSTIEADLRNADPLGSQSAMFGITQFPYFQNAADDPVELDPGLMAGTAYTYYLNEKEECSNTASGISRPRYRMTLTYTDVPAANELTPALARLIISWPTQFDPDVPAQAANIVGSVETLISFPVP